MKSEGEGKGEGKTKNLFCSKVTRKKFPFILILKTSYTCMCVRASILGVHVVTVVIEGNNRIYAVKLCRTT